MKKHTGKNLVLLIISIVVIAFLVFGIFRATQTKSASNDPVDLSDIEDMNIGAEMPEFIYASKERVIMKGTFGILFYDLNKKKVTDRITYERLSEYNMKKPYIEADKDGKTIYFADYPESFSEAEYKCRYDISKHRFYDMKSEKPTETFKADIAEPGGECTFYMDDSYLNGFTIFKEEGRFMYLRAKTDWSMKTLQLVINSYDKANETVYDIFGAVSG